MITAIFNVLPVQDLLNINVLVVEVVRIFTLMNVLLVVQFNIMEIQINVMLVIKLVEHA